RDVLHDVDQLIYRDQVAAAKIQRLDKVAVHDHLRAFHAIVDPLKTASLFTVAPDFDLMFPGTFCFDYFAANRRRRFFATAVVSAPPTVYFVITRDAGR